MHDFEIILILLAIALGLGILAEWMAIPYPILLVVGGLLISLQDIPPFELSPDVIFLAFLPPLLYSAAFNTHWASFRKQIRAISLLAVGLVLFSTVLVAVAGYYVVGLSWPSAFVLGAVVSPPDAVAALAITRRVKVPKIITTILEGESLVNDASALVAVRMAVAAAVGATVTVPQAGTNFIVMSAGGIVLGLLGAILVIQLHKLLNRSRLGDSKTTIALTLLTPYAVYLPAEHLHVSGVLAAVSAGLWVGNRCRHVFHHEQYIEAKAVWEMIEFLLNGLIFILIGFQLPIVLRDLNDESPDMLCYYAAVISAVVIVSRLVWVFPGAYIPRWLDRQLFACTEPYPPPSSVFIVGWTGMRGVVSLAAAMALDPKVEGRPMIQFLTFWVIFATLVGQGLTLPFLIRWLGVSRSADPEQSAANQASC